MKICILSGNPKKEGLCQSVIEAAKAGALEAGAEIDEIRLSGLDVMRCQVCGDGWGPCRNDHFCSFGQQDDFDAIRERVRACDVLVLATPVYWGETSEATKAFLDRFRRCEFQNRAEAEKKQVLLIASAGGSGNGLLTCLEQLDRFCRHVGFTIFDRVGINRWNSDYKRDAVKNAVRALAGGRRNGESI